LIEFLRNVQSIIPDLNKNLVVVGGIDHEFAIITILVINRVEKKNLASLGTLDGNSVPMAGNAGLAHFKKAAFFGAAVITLPFERVGGDNRYGLHGENSVVLKLKKVKRRVLFGVKKSKFFDRFSCTFFNDLLE
jgi:hypothetical protein